MAEATPTLTDFLLARIAEDEAIAQAAAGRQGARWFDEEGIVSSDAAPSDPPSGHLNMYAPDGRWMLWDCEGASSLCVHGATSAHMARHDPARVLAECEARRRIVEMHAPIEVYREQPLVCTICVMTDDSGGYVIGGPKDVFPCQTLRALASVYAEHPDYRWEWKP